MMEVEQFRKWWPIAPGACRDLQLGVSVPKVTRRELDRILAEPPPEFAADSVWFPVVRDGWPEGYLAAVRVGSGGNPVPMERVKKAVHWLGLLGIPVQETRMRWELAPEDEVQGDSCDAAIAVALCLDALRHRPSQAVIVSATTLEKEGQAVLGPVQHLETKIRIVLREAPKHLLLTCQSVTSSPFEILLSLFPKDWKERLGVTSSYSRTRAAWNAYQHRHYIEAERQAQLAIATDPNSSARAYWVRGACALHRGEAAQASADFQQCRLRTEPDGEEWEEEELLAYQVVAALDNGHPRLMKSELEKALETLLAAKNRKKRWKEVTLQVAGSLHRLEVLEGQFAEAARLLHDLGLQTAGRPEEAARTLGDLAEVYRRQGQLELARQTIREARTQLPHTLLGQRPITARFLSLYASRCGAASPEDYPIAAPDWRDWPQPAEVIEHLLHRPSSEFERWITDFILTDDLTVVRMLVVLAAGSRHPEPPDAVRRLGAKLAEKVAEEPIHSLAMQAAAGEFSEWRRRGPY